MRIYAAKRFSSSMYFSSGSANERMRLDEDDNLVRIKQEAGAMFIALPNATALDTLERAILLCLAFLRHDSFDTDQTYSTISVHSYQSSRL